MKPSREPVPYWISKLVPLPVRMSKRDGAAVCVVILETVFLEGMPKRREEQEGRRGTLLFLTRECHSPVMYIPSFFRLNLKQGCTTRMIHGILYVLQPLSVLHYKGYLPSALSTLLNPL